jgi:hypothetical protein
MKGSKGKTSHAECISKVEFKKTLVQQRAEMIAQFNDLFQRNVEVNVRRFSIHTTFYGGSYTPDSRQLQYHTSASDYQVNLFIFILN